jgi:hypothetical protein
MPRASSKGPVRSKTRDSRSAEKREPVRLESLARKAIGWLAFYAACEVDSRKRVHLLTAGWALERLLEKKRKGRLRKWDRKRIVEDGRQVCLTIGDGKRPTALRLAQLLQKRWPGRYGVSPNTLARQISSKMIDEVMLWQGEGRAWQEATEP